MTNGHSTGGGWFDRSLSITVILLHLFAVYDHFKNIVRASVAGWLPPVIVLGLYGLLWLVYIFRIARRHGRFKVFARVFLAVSTITVILILIPPRVIVTELPAEFQVLIVDVENKTGESTFPVDALRNALTMALKESTRISIPPESRIQDVLRRMGKSPTERVSIEIGRDICRREGLGLLIAAVVAKSEDGYKLQTSVLDPQKGTVLYETAIGPFEKEGGAQATRQLADVLRKKFGESSWSIYRAATPLAQATTKSLDALELYSQALKLLSEVKYSEAEQTLNKALALDPDLALAWVELASIYDYQGKNSEMRAYATRAFTLRDRLTIPERVRVDDFYYWHVENDHQRALSELTDFLDKYPKNQDRFASLAFESWMLMKFDMAEEAYRKVLGNRPWGESAEESSYDLWQIQLSRNNFNEALETASYIEQDIPKAAYLPYVMIIPKLTRGETDAARTEINRLHQTGDMRAALWLGGFSDIYGGRLQSAADQWVQYIRAVEHSERSEEPWIEVGKVHLGLARIALLGGKNNEASLHLKEVKDVRDEYLAEAAKYYARLGNWEEAQRMMEDLKQRVAGRESNQNRALLALIEGEIELKKGNAERAFTLLSAAAAYPWTYLFFPIQESLGNAALASGHYDAAIRTFKSIIDHKGLAAASDRPEAWIMAQYDAGRSYEAAGDKPMALSYYMQFEQFWRDGDATLPILVDVRNRIAQLKR